VENSAPPSEERPQIFFLLNCADRGVKNRFFIGPKAKCCLGNILVIALDMIWTIVVSAVAVIVTVGVLMGGATVAFTYIRSNAPVSESPQDALQLRVAELEVKVQALPSLWEEERKRAKRAQGAAESARRSAEEKLEEVEEIIAEHGHVPAGDGDGSEQRELLPLRRNMGVSAQAGIEDRVAAVAHLLT